MRPRYFVPLVAACLTAAQNDVKFEVLSMKPLSPGSSLTMNTSPSPNGFVSTLSLWQMLMIAWFSADTTDWKGNQVVNGPAWIGDFYTINARVSQADLKAWQNQSRDHELLRSALRMALQERCKLVIHEQASQSRILELVIGKGGPRLKASAPDAPLPFGVKLPSGGVMVGTGVKGRDGWNFYGATLEDLAWQLRIASSGMPVRNKTGLAGRFDFPLPAVPISPDDEHVYRFPVGHLGLKLKPGTESRPLLVIDHMERPVGN